MKKIYKNNLFLLLVFFFIITLIVFRKFIFQGLLPIPTDILVGAYFPWLDSKWGYPVGVPVKNPLPSDVISLLIPWRTLGIEQLKQGLLPLWDDTILLGTPLLANFQSALLNPLNILYFIFSSPISWSIQIMLQPFFILTATYIYLKNLQINRLSAVFGALGFTFSGFSIVWMPYNTIGYTLIFVPLIFLLTDKVITNPKFIFIFLYALCLSLQIFSGYPQISLYTLLFAGIYFLYRLYFYKTKYLKIIGTYMLANILGLLFSAIQIIPSIELLQNSIRGLDQTAAAGNIQYLPIQHLLSFFIPDFFGNPATGNYSSIGSYDNFAFSLPVITILFSIISLTFKNTFNKQNLIFIILAALSLILATNNPLSNLLINSNFLGLKSAVAARVLFIFDFALVVLSAITLDQILKKPLRLFQYLLPLSVFLGIFIAVSFSYFYLYYDLWQPYSESYLTRMTKEIQPILVSFRNTLQPTLLILIAIILMCFIRRFRKISLLLLLIILIFDITRSTDKYIPFTPPHLFYPHTEVTDYLKQESNLSRFEREAAQVIPANTWIPYGLKTAGGQNALYPQSSSEYFSLVNGSSSTGRFVDIKNFSSPLFDTLDIELVTLLNRDKVSSIDETGTPLKELLVPKLQEVKNIQSVRIFRNTSNLGSAWFPNSIICQQDTQLIKQNLSSLNYNPQESVYINCNEKIKTSNTISSVRKIEEQTTRSKYDVSTSVTNYLVLSRAYYPGWVAYLNQTPVPINTANIALMAVKIPPGQHTLELKYQPLSFYIGTLISLISLAFTSLVFLFIKIRKK